MRYSSTAPLHIPFLQRLSMMILVMLMIQCRSAQEEKPAEWRQINSAHLDALYDEIPVEGDTVGIIHIYSEYPDYHHVGDEDEGIACVDDVSRAAVFYLRQHASGGDPEHLRKGRMLLEFVLKMQAPNGYYYNFIWPDGRIHREGPTTKAEPDWWSWRALWVLGEAIALLDTQEEIIERMRRQRDHLVVQILQEERFGLHVTDTVMGITLPTWLPHGSGADQTSYMLLGLTRALEQYSASSGFSKDTLIARILHLTEGIIMMQVEEPDSLQDGAFLSWENLWHAYGNIQSYALLTVGQVLEDPHLIAHALYEIDHFYPAILAAGGLDHFWVRVMDGKLVRFDTEVFSQIAYGKRPMIWAAVKAYEITGEEKYISLALKLAAWFSGENPAKTLMYDPATGRGYDGINGPDQINQNAGAESTMEALLSLQAIEKYAVQ